VARAWAAAGVLAAMTAGCAAVAPLTLPGGSWAPEPGGDAALASATAACGGVRTLTAEIAIRGQVGGQRLRGRVLAGFERGGAIRLEAPAPFGAPFFILTARADRGTLWLPRDRRLLRDAPVADILDAIVGLRRSSDDLLGLLAGCLAAARPVASGDGARRNPAGWLMATLEDGTVAYLRRDGSTWRLQAGHREAAANASSWSVNYERFAPTFPDLVRISTVAPAGTPGPGAVLSLEVSQRETNTPIDARAFEAVAAPDARPMTLDELRRTGPLADRAGAPGSGS
jgi:hypothetical protein